MKSVKNFFIERINSLDHGNNSDASSTGSGATSKHTKHQLDKLKYVEAIGGTSTSTPCTPTVENDVPPNTPPPPIGSISQTTSLSSAMGQQQLSAITPTSNGSSPMGSERAAANAAIGSMTSPPETTCPFNFAADGGRTAAADYGGSVGNAHVATSVSTPLIKPQKSRRKISLPWFRQSSVTSHVSLSRQHTIDTPSSFRLFRQPSNNFKVGAHEVC